MRKLRRVCTLLGSTPFPGFPGSAALAQGPVKGVLEACEPEITTYCDQVTPLEGRILSCMYAHGEATPAFSGTASPHLPEPYE
ncbi:MAG: cysteine rich repeat-containing protein [Pseudomonadota bacterium]